MACAAALALTALAVPATAQDVGDRAMAALSARLFPMLDAAGRNPAALARSVGGSRRSGRWPPGAIAGRLAGRT